MASIACRRAGDASSSFKAIFIVQELSFDTSPSILELTPNKSLGVISNARHRSATRVEATAFLPCGIRRSTFAVSAVLTTTISSKLLGAKRVATGELSGFQAGQKLAGALCRSTVGKCVGHNVALRAPLQSIVSNG